MFQVTQSEQKAWDKICEKNKNNQAQKNVEIKWSGRRMVERYILPGPIVGLQVSEK